MHILLFSFFPFLPPSPSPSLLSFSLSSSSSLFFRQEPGGRKLSRGYGGVLITGWLPMGLLNLLSYIAQNHLPREGTTHSGLAIPTSIINQEKFLTDLPPGQSYEGNFSVEVPSAEGNDPVRVKLTETTWFRWSLCFLFGEWP